MASPSGSTSSVAADWTVRPFNDADRGELLRLNAANYPSVHTLDEVTLAWLLSFDGHHLVAVDQKGTVLGYLLSYFRGSAYDDSEINELRRRVAESFLYICQVVITREYRGRGVGRAFYEAVAKAARLQGVGFLCCDVNTNPPNPGSFAFHRRMGFAEIGSGTASNGFSIAFLIRRL